jgi:hypothetical protein
VSIETVEISATFPRPEGDVRKRGKLAGGPRQGVGMDANGDGERDERNGDAIPKSGRGRHGGGDSTMHQERREIKQGRSQGNAAGLPASFNVRR